MFVLFIPNLHFYPSKIKLKDRNNSNLFLVTELIILNDVSVVENLCCLNFTLLKEVFFLDFFEVVKQMISVILKTLKFVSCNNKQEERNYLEIENFEKTIVINFLFYKCKNSKFSLSKAAVIY